MMVRFENLVLTIWVGCLLAIGYIAAPVLFSALDDRMLAGNLAGHMFTIVGIVGLACGLVLLAVQFIKEGKLATRQWRFWVLVFMMLLVALSQFIIQPIMADLKLQGLEPGSDVSKEFGRMHGISSSLYMLTSIAGVALAWAGMNSNSPRVKSLSDVHQL